MGPSTHPRMTLQRVREILAELKGLVTLSSKMGEDVQHIRRSRGAVEAEDICIIPSSENERLLLKFSSDSLTLQPAEKAATQVLPAVMPMKKLTPNAPSRSKSDGLAGSGKSKRKGSPSDAAKTDKRVYEKDLPVSPSSGSKGGHKQPRYKMSNARKERSSHDQSGTIETGLDTSHAHHGTAAAYFELSGHGNKDENQRMNSPTERGSRVRSKTYHVRDTTGRQLLSALDPDHGVSGASARECKRKAVEDDALRGTTSRSIFHDSDGTSIHKTDPFKFDEEGSGQEFCISEKTEVIKKGEEMKVRYRFLSEKCTLQNHTGAKPLTNTTNAGRARKDQSQRAADADAELPRITYTAGLRPGSSQRLEDWDPPMSPFGLIQETFSHDAWKVLLSSMLLNKATGRPVEKIISELFEFCPDAESVVKMETERIAVIVFSLGLQNKRAKVIQRFSFEFLRGHWINVEELHGIGKYARDAYAIFYQGLWREVGEPDDPPLASYWNWLLQIYGSGS